MRHTDEASEEEAVSLNTFEGKEKGWLQWPVSPNARCTSASCSSTTQNITEKVAVSVYERDCPSVYGIFASAASTREAAVADQLSATAEETRLESTSHVRFQEREHTFKRCLEDDPYHTHIDEGDQILG